jgi:hypothetical protein
MARRPPVEAQANDSGEARKSLARTKRIEAALPSVRSTLARTCWVCATTGPANSPQATDVVRNHTAQTGVWFRAGPRTQKAIVAVAASMLTAIYYIPSRRPSTTASWAVSISSDSIERK